MNLKIEKKKVSLKPEAEIDKQLKIVDPIIVRNYNMKESEN